MKSNSSELTSKESLKPEGSKEFKSGLTWRSLLAMIYTVFVFLPAIVYLQLMTIGVSFGGAVSFCTILMVIELARISGSPFRKQEAVILFLLSVLATSPANNVLNLIYRSYFVQSSVAARFGLTLQIPKWYVPPVGSGAYAYRSFFQLDWTLPLAVFAIIEVFLFASSLFYGLFARELYMEYERLPFPLQQVDAEVIVTLTERKEDRLSALIVGAIPSLIYCTLLYTVPTAANAFGVPIRLIPIPWIDFSNEIGKIFPGAGFGVATDAALFASGLILPLRTILSMLAGSLGVFVIGNGVLVGTGISLWAARYTPGMDFSTLWQQSTLYFWAGPIIGMALAAGLAPLIVRPKFLVKAFRSIFSFGRISKETRYTGEAFSGKFLITLYLVGTVGPIALNYWLVPDFPIWASILYQAIFPFIVCITAVRMIGETGQSFTPPYLSQMTILFSGYPKADAWFLPFTLTPGTWWASNFKVAELTETTATSYIKAYAISLPLALVLAFIYISIFWDMAPIPSATYPSPAIQWPITATYQAIWITRPQGFFDPQLIVGFFAGTAVLSGIFSFVKVPISMSSFVVGASTPLPIVTTIFIGSIVGQIITKALGKKWFNTYRATIAAGITLGEGIAIVIGSALAIIGRAIWISPY